MNLTEVDLGIAGRFAAATEVHRLIGKIQPGDSLELGERDGKWELFDSSGSLVVRMTRAFKLRSDIRVRETSVAVESARVDAGVDPELQDHFRVSKWEVVVPHFVLEPIGRATSTKRSTSLKESSRHR